MTSRTTVNLKGNNFVLFHNSGSVSSVKLPGDFMDVTSQMKRRPEYVQALQKKGYTLA